MNNPDNHQRFTEMYGETTKRQLDTIFASLTQAEIETIYRQTLIELNCRIAMEKAIESAVAGNTIDYQTEAQALAQIAIHSLQEATSNGSLIHLHPPELKPYQVGITNPDDYPFLVDTAAKIHQRTLKDDPKESREKAKRTIREELGHLQALQAAISEGEEVEAVQLGISFTPCKADESGKYAIGFNGFIGVQGQIKPETLQAMYTEAPLATSESDQTVIAYILNQQPSPHKT
jgi:hypothetical protein